MKTTTACLFIASATLAFGQVPSQERPPGRTGPPPHAMPMMRGMMEQDAERVIENWKEESRAAAEQMLAQYGKPDEVTEQRLIWHDKDPWKRIEVVNEAVEHNFPMPHKDMLYQTINYHVPAEKAADLAEFTGSILVDRVKGELTARCDKEAANFLSLNLAHRIVSDDLSVETARRMYAEAVGEEQHPELMEELAFDVPEEPQGDPGTMHAVFAGREDQEQQDR